ncbi:MAG: hypothetical protein HKN33_11675 [Pyrinomonadaceae bacterium]|nr:hypothetical protein [Pyrinomonadaceae bacterium]
MNRQGKKAADVLVLPSEARNRAEWITGNGKKKNPFRVGLARHSVRGTNLNR